MSRIISCTWYLVYWYRVGARYYCEIICLETQAEIVEKEEIGRNKIR